MNNKIITNLLLGLLVLVLVFGIFKTAYEVRTDSNTWRYRITVEIETPEGVKTGSAVWQMSNFIPLIDLLGLGNSSRVKGEAVVVDMGERGVLFALISSDSDTEFYNAFRHLWSRGGLTSESIKFYASMPIGTKGVLSPHDSPGYPKLVTFTDMNDPKSVTLAQEWEWERGKPMQLKANYMEELFGKGVKLKDITLEITDDKVTWGVVDRWLPWLVNLGTTLLDGSKVVTSNKLSNNLGAGSFRRGEKK